MSGNSPSAALRQHAVFPNTLSGMYLRFGFTSLYRDRNSRCGFRFFSSGYRIVLYAGRIRKNRMLGHSNIRNVLCRDRFVCGHRFFALPLHPRKEKPCFFRKFQRDKTLPNHVLDTRTGLVTRRCPLARNQRRTDRLRQSLGTSRSGSGELAGDRRGRRGLRIDRGALAGLSFERRFSVQ